jgi:hypothetical protein
MATRRRRPFRSGLNALVGGLALSSVVLPLGLLGLLEVGALGGLLVVATTTACSLTGFATCSAADVRRWPGMGPVVAAGVAAGLVLLVLVGWLRLEAPLAPVSAALALATAPTAVWAWRCTRGVQTPAGQRGPTEGELVALVVVLPTDVLLAEWATSGMELATRPGLTRECVLVRLRRVLLDELETRDADAFAAWQREAGRRQCSPAEFLNPQEQEH